MKKIVTVLFLAVAVVSQAQVNNQVKVQPQAIVLPKAVIAAPQCAFMANATFVGGEPVGNNNNHKVIFSGTVFDEGKNFNAADGSFTAPSDGIYHFDVRVDWIQFSSPGIITINLNTSEFNMVATSVQSSSTVSPVFDCNFGTLLKLKAGQKVYVYLKQASAGQQRYQQVQLAGFKVD